MPRTPISLRRRPLLPRSGIYGLAAVLILLFLSGCSHQPLQPWHTEALTAEFTAAKAAEFHTFEGYRRLEDRLFAELDEKVVAATPTGPAYALVRYSRGSAADPEKQATNWNRSFELTAEAPAGGVLLLHGMSDSPYSLRALGRRLNQRGYWGDRPAPARPRYSPLGAS